MADQTDTDDFSLATPTDFQAAAYAKAFCDVDLLAVYPDQLARPRRVVVVDADGQSVHAGLPGARRRATLAHREPGEPPVGVDVEIRGQGVQAGGLEPLRAPVGQVAAR